MNQIVFFKKIKIRNHLVWLIDEYKKIFLKLLILIDIIGGIIMDKMIIKINKIGLKMLKYRM